MPIRAIRIACFTALSLAGLPGLAGRPLVTEDAGVLERGACELESFALHQSERASPSADGTSVQLGCGIGWRTQLALAAAREPSAGATNQLLALGGKTGLIEAHAGTSWTLAWGLIALKSDGGALRHDVGYLNVVASRPVADQLVLHANLGWSRSRSADASTTRWNLALERPWRSNLDVMAEVFGNDRSHSPWMQAALRWTVVPQTFYLDGSWGVQTSGTRAKVATIGLKLSF